MMACVQDPPNSPEELDRWAFHNSTAVTAINNAIKAQYGITLAQYQLYPLLVQDPSNWLNWNSLAHSAFNSVLNLTGHNIQDVDFDDIDQLEAWVNLVYQELLAACNKLGIAP